MLNKHFRLGSNILFFREWVIGIILFSCLTLFFVYQSMVLNQIGSLASNYVSGVGQIGLDATWTLFGVAMLIIVIGVLVWAAVSATRQHTDTGRWR